jgi:hypothetical protein
MSGAREPCESCGGTGGGPVEKPGDIEDGACPDCKGTGKSGAREAFPDDRCICGKRRAHGYHVEAQGGRGHAFGAQEASPTGPAAMSAWGHKPEREAFPRDGMVRVFIDDEGYRVRPDVAGEFLLSLRPLPRARLQDWRVWREVPGGEDEDAGWDRPLNLTGGERFYTVPKHITAAAPGDPGVPAENENERAAAARFVYEGARLQAIAVDAPVVPEPWSEREAPFREQFLEVIGRQCGPDRSHSPAGLHDDWVRAYEAMGWRYGEHRDREAKTHPDMVPFGELEQREQDKDAVFMALCDIARQWILHAPSRDPDELTAKIDLSRRYNSGDDHHGQTERNAFWKGWDEHRQWAAPGVLNPSAIIEQQAERIEELQDQLDPKGIEAAVKAMGGDIHFEGDIDFEDHIAPIKQAKLESAEAMIRAYLSTVDAP